MRRSRLRLACWLQAPRRTRVRFSLAATARLNRKPVWWTGSSWRGPNNPARSQRRDSRSLFAASIAWPSLNGAPRSTWPRPSQPRARLPRRKLRKILTRLWTRVPAGWLGLVGEAEFRRSTRISRRSLRVFLGRGGTWNCNRGKPITSRCPPRCAANNADTCEWQSLSHRLAVRIQELHLSKLQFSHTSRIVAMSFCEPRSCIGRLSS